MAKEYTEQDIKQVAEALKQVVSVDPQLLFMAAKECAVDIMLDTTKELVAEQPNTKRIEKLQYRSGLCAYLAKILIQSGRAHLTDEDYTAVASYMNLLGR